VLKISEPFETSGMDLALLQVATSDLPAMAMTLSDTPKLTRVIAAGFPADVMETDSAFAALMSGDVTAMPELSVADGIVTSQQTVQGGASGPLVDYCGAVVGVNTFVRLSEFRNLNIALSANDLRRFLEGTPASSVLGSATPCQPVLVDKGTEPDPAGLGNE
jgi:S1-C subfamily serine protease